MAFYQVVEDKNAASGKSVVQLSGGTNVGAAAALAAAQAAQQTADEALPLDGSKNMTGVINWKSETLDRDVNPEAAIFLNQLFAKDKNGKNLMSLYTAQRANGDTMTDFAVLTTGTDGEQVKGGFTANVQRDGESYLGIVTPGDNAPTSAIVNKAYVQDRLIHRLAGNKSIHVWPSHANASDTANLWFGRGDPDKPFASLEAALRFGEAVYASPSWQLNIVLHENMAFDNLLTYPQNVGGVLISSADSANPVTLALTGVFRPGRGYTAFGGIRVALASMFNQFGTLEIRANTEITATDASAILFNNYGRGAITLIASDNIVFGGACACVLAAGRGGCVDMRRAVTGAITGKKYDANMGGLIVGSTYIPGTEAGTADSNSKAI